jgi:uncharacterized membrane protein YphA (DoxX/SURF4 family)
MKQAIKNFFFGTSLQGNNTIQIIWLLFRLHVGLSMAIHAGLPKMIDLAPPAWFVQQVNDIGFTFISAKLWAALAAWGEFVGGLCIAFGFLTRFAAAQLCFQFFVISFIWYKDPEFLTGMNFQQLYFWAYLLVAVFGGGRWAIDYYVFNKIKPRIFNFKSKKMVAVALVAFSLASCHNASSQPLKGSGNVITKTFDYANFDKVNISDIDGSIEIVVGKPFAITIEIDDNLQNLLQVKNNDGELQICFVGNENNKLYVEDTKVKITINMPEISVFKHKGNSNCILKNIVGRYLRIKNIGNGNVTVKGLVDEFDLIQKGNGNVQAGDFVCKKIKINRSGNGNAIINTDAPYEATSHGNGNIENRGKGKQIEEIED